MVGAAPDLGHPVGRGRRAPADRLPEATAALTDAAEQGSRGVRTAARQQLARGVATRRPRAAIRRRPK